MSTGGPTGPLPPDGDDEPRYERDPEKPPLTAKQQELVEAQRQLFKLRARRRAIGWTLIVSVVVLVLLPLSLVLGFEAGFFVWAFNVARSV